MIKVITYGSYDLLHYGHISLLKRAKALGDYLIVGVTSDDYDKTRGKINLQQTLMERVEALRATGIPDEIIIEEYEGQKIDDIKRYDIDIFTVGSDWTGYFDYLNEYCKVIYLPRTDGVSSSEIREKNRYIMLGLLGDTRFLNKLWNEAKSVNGINISAVHTKTPEILDKNIIENGHILTDNFDDFLSCIDAVYIRSLPKFHFPDIKSALNAGKHVLYESPLTLSRDEGEKLINLAKENCLILMEAIKTAYATAYERLLLLVKGGKIGQVISVDATCTSIRKDEKGTEWNCIHEWGPTALLPIFQILGINYIYNTIVTHFDENGRDTFTKMDFIYEHCVGSIKIGDGVKSEGELIISGTNGYIYVPAPWWKTDYFEVRYEDQSQNKRYFYQLDGEGIRYELVSFVRAIEHDNKNFEIAPEITLKIIEVMEKYEKREGVVII